MYVGIWCLKYRNLCKTLIRTATLTSIQHTVPSLDPKFQFSPRLDRDTRTRYKRSHARAHETQLIVQPCVHSSTYCSSTKLTSLVTIPTA